MVKFENLTKEDAEKILHSDLPQNIIEHLSKPYPISEEQINFYQKNGFGKMKN